MKTAKTIQKICVIISGKYGCITFANKYINNKSKISRMPAYIRI